MSKSFVSGLRISGQDRVYSKELYLTHPMGIAWQLTFRIWAGDTQVTCTLEEISLCCRAVFKFQTAMGLLSHWEQRLQRDSTEEGQWVCSTCKAVPRDGQEPRYLKTLPSVIESLEQVIAPWLTPHLENPLTDTLAAYDLRLALEIYCARVKLTEEHSWGFASVLGG